jgi:1-pyrroline-5-carboxylate dehydrogenase
MIEPFRNEPTHDYTTAAAVAAYREALEVVRSRLGADHPLTIGGRKVAPGGWIASFNPSHSDELVGRSAKAGPAEAEQALEAARLAYRTWSQWPMADRARALVRLATIMRRRKLELSAWMTVEASKNYAEAEADTAEAIDFVDYYARQSLQLDGPLPTVAYPGEDNTSFLIPMGVGVVIPPWNFPLAILTGMTIGPVAVGNTVVLKPSSDTPIIAQMFMECVEEAGFPPGVVNLVTGDSADIGDLLVEHPSTRFINFTGSLATGMRINERAARVQPGQEWIKRCYLELGGKDALVVDETADPDLAVAAAVASGYGFQGQKCSAMSRLIVVDDVYDEILDGCVEAVGRLTLGPAEENPNVAAVINGRAQDKILGYVEKGMSDARLVAGGSAGPDGGYYIQPTIFADVPPESAIACEEIFGPVVSVLRARDYEHALDLANATVFGLTGGVISRDRSRLEEARRRFHAGNLYLNRKITGALVGVQPFGGFKLSGSNSKAGGPDYLRLFMEMKTVTERF